MRLGVDHSSCRRATLDPTDDNADCRFHTGREWRRRRQLLVEPPTNNNLSLSLFFGSQCQWKCNILFLASHHCKSEKKKNWKSPLTGGRHHKVFRTGSFAVGKIWELLSFVFVLCSCVFFIWGIWFCFMFVCFFLWWICGATALQQVAGKIWQLRQSLRLYFRSVASLLHHHTQRTNSLKGKHVEAKFQCMCGNIWISLDNDADSEIPLLDLEQLFLLPLEQRERECGTVSLSFSTSLS